MNRRAVIAITQDALLKFLKEFMPNVPRDSRCVGSWVDGRGRIVLAVESEHLGLVVDGEPLPYICWPLKTE